MSEIQLEVSNFPSVDQQLRGLLAIKSNKLKGHQKPKAVGHNIHRLYLQYCNTTATKQFCFRFRSQLRFPIVHKQH